MKKHYDAVHKGIKNHVCEHCSKAFADSRHMREHVKTVHEGLKEYMCDKCNQVFGHLSSLKRDELTLRQDTKMYALFTPACKIRAAQAHVSKSTIKFVNQGNYAIILSI